MKVVEITDIERRESPLLYRRTFTATAVLSTRNGPDERKRIEFTLEHAPLGPVQVRVAFLEEIDYPLVPALAAIKEHVRKLEENGELS